MDSSDYQAGRNGNLMPPGGDWSDFQQGVGDQQQWQANNDAVRRRSADFRSDDSTETGAPSALWWLRILWGLFKLVAVVWIVYKLFFA